MAFEHRAEAKAFSNEYRCPCFKYFLIARVEYANGEAVPTERQHGFIFCGVIPINTLSSMQGKPLFLPMAAMLSWMAPMDCRQVQELYWKRNRANTG